MKPEQTDSSQGQPYDAFYFSHCCTPGLPYERSEHWLRFFDGIAEHIATELQPASVLDAGCALGFLVESLRKRDIAAFGVDISEYAIQNVHADIRPYCWTGSIIEPLPQEYDLIVSIEVLEHLPAREAEQVVANLCKYSQRVLFSSTPREFRESTHVNVQPVEHWAKLFARHGFIHDLDYDASFITSWAMLFRRQKLTPEQIVQQYERKLAHLALENWDLRVGALEMRRQLAANYETFSKLQAQASEYSDLQAQLNQLQTCQDELAMLKNSRGWRLLDALRRSKPYNSLYARIYQRWLKPKQENR
ncbi:MAG: class I SAM-dependent methyltransferase [Chloroflexota bacterium]